MEEKYNFKQVIAYGMVAFRNYLTSANNGKTDAEQFGRLFIEPLEKIYKKEDVIKIAIVLLERKSTNS